MGVTKYNLQRVKRLLSMLKENRYPNYPRFLAAMKRMDIAGAYSLSARTLQRDIAFLKSEYRAPIAYDYEQRGYYLTDPDWSADIPLLDDPEMTAGELEMKETILRQERPSQYREMEELVRDAFWDKYRPGCAEHLVVHELRASPAAVPELCLAAEEDGELVGGIWYAQATIRDGKTVHPVLTMGPVCVRPDWQSRGVGATLIRKTLTAASGMAPAVVIYGDLDYYRRFGFRPASEFGITDADGAECPAILVCPLAGEVPEGAFDEGGVYHVEPEAVDAFDRSFPHRQKHYDPQQLFFFPPTPPPEDPLLFASWEMRNRAEKLLRASRVLEAWESLGGKIRGVGSFRSGLMMKHRDIDLHVYTDMLDVSRTLEALAPVIASKRTVGLSYINGSDTEERCLEWHLRLKDDAGETWKLDMIQILAGTKYDGVIEDDAEDVIAALTPEFRKRILELKNACPDDLNICGIEYCRAVISGGVTSWREFMDWRSGHPRSGR